MKESEPSTPNLAPIQAKYISRNPLLRLANRRYLNTIRSFLTGLEFESLLDVGCGEGIVFHQISQQFGNHIVGVDYDQSRLEFARIQQGSTRLVAGDAHTLPFNDRSFDIVLALELLEHVGNPKKVLAEARRIARQHLLVSVPREPWWRIGNMVRLKYLRNLGNTPEHANHWTLSDFKDFVAEELSIVEVKTPFLWTFVLARV